MLEVITAIALGVLIGRLGSSLIKVRCGNDPHEAELGKTCSLQKFHRGPHFADTPDGPIKWQRNSDGMLVVHH